MVSAARIAASFMLALFATVGPMVLAVLFPWRGFEGAAGFYIAVVLLMLLPMTIVSGLAWLPVMLAARKRGFEGELGAVTMSPLAAAVFWALYITYQGHGHDLGKPNLWGAMTILAPIMIVFCSAFFYLDRRWGQTEGAPASTRVMMAAAALLTAWVLFVLMLIFRLWPRLFASIV